MMNVKVIRLLGRNVVCPLLVLCASLVITSDGLAAFTTIVDFQFNEVAGTVLADDPADGPNSAVTDSVSGYSWALHNPTGSGDKALQTILTDGSGFIDASTYTDSDRGDGSIALAAADLINTTQNQLVRATAVLAPWDFSGSTSNTEEFRIGLGASSATDTVAAIEFERDSADEITIRGFSGGDDGAGQDLFDDVQTDSVKLILELNTLTEIYSVFTQVGAGPINALTDNTGLSVAAGDNAVGFLRIGFDNDFTGNTFKVDSYTIEVMTIPEPASAVLLLGVAIGLSSCRLNRRGV